MLCRLGRLRVHLRPAQDKILKISELLNKGAAAVHNFRRMLSFFADRLFAQLIYPFWKRYHVRAIQRIEKEK
jgi:hypothetical protein